MEGKITRSSLAERQNLLAPDCLSAPFLHLVGFLKSFVQNFLKADLHGTTLSYAINLRQVYDMNRFVQI